MYDNVTTDTEVMLLREENKHLRRLLMEYEIQWETKNYYERILEEIGRTIGCGHLDDNLPKCVVHAIACAAGIKR